MVQTVHGQLREMIEVPAMARLARLGLREQAEADARDRAVLCSQWAREGDVARFLAADRDLHLGLTELLGNERMVRAVAQLRDQSRLYGLAVLADGDLLSAAAAEHHDLIDAIAARDEEAARAIMAAHLQHVRGDWAAHQSGTVPTPAPTERVT